jgi:hypothetical protein
LINVSDQLGGVDELVNEKRLDHRDCDEHGPAELLNRGERGARRKY